MTESLLLNDQFPMRSLLLILALTFIGRLDPTLLASFTAAVQLIHPASRLP